MIIVQPRWNGKRWKVVETSDENDKHYRELCPCEKGHDTAADAITCPHRIDKPSASDLLASAPVAYGVSEPKKNATCGDCPFAFLVSGVMNQRECRGASPVILPSRDGSLVSMHPRVDVTRPTCGMYELAGLPTVLTALRDALNELTIFMGDEETP